MPERQTDPPPEQMIRSIRTPDHTTGFYTELVDRTSTRFQALDPIKHGTRYSSTVGADQEVVDLYGANLFFLRETVPLAGTVRGMEGSTFVIWNWGTAPDAESSFNASISYFLESTSCPIYTRTYTIRRSVYETTPFIAPGTAFTGLTGVTITAGGTGYTYATGTRATGATCEFIISGGVIVDAVVTNEGTGVTSGGSITITGDGTGATATAKVQPATAVLIHQEKKEFPEDDPRALEFVSVLRVYRTLPGPVLSDRVYDSDKGALTLTTQQLATTGSEVASESFSASTKTKTQYESVKDNVNLIDKKIETSTLPGPQFSEQSYVDTFDFVEPKTRQRVATSAAGVGTNRREIRAIDSVESEIIDIDITAIAAILNAYSISIPSTATFQLPDVLQSISAVMETNSGEGAYTETGSGFAYSPGGWSLNIPGRGQASAAILPDLTITIKQSWAHNIPSTRYIFFLQIPVTTTDVTNRLTALVGATVSAWPKFSPISHTILCIGQRLSLQVNTSASEQDSLSGSDGEGYSESSGSGYSKEVGLSIKAIRIPPTIHGVINIGGNTSDTIEISATAFSSTGNIEADESRSGEVSGSITPISLSATANDSTIPSSGKRIVNVEGQPYRYGYAIMHAEVVDFADVG